MRIAISTGGGDGSLTIGNLVFSKKALRRHAEPAEILQLITRSG
jgi:hypothetical protein